MAHANRRWARWRVPAALVPLALLAAFVAWRMWSRTEPGADAIRSGTTQDEEETSALESPAEPSGREAALPRPEPAATRRCRVVEDPAGAPIERATLTFSKTGSNPGRYETDQQGICGVQPVALQGAELRIDAKGFFPVGFGSEEISKLTAAPGDLEFQMHRSGRLLVRVSDEEGRPISQALVQVFLGPSRERSSALILPRVWPRPPMPRGDRPSSLDPLEIYPWTDEHGEIRFELLPCDVSLTVIASGTVPETRGTTEIQSKTGSQEVVLRVVRFGALSGKLVWEDGEPAEEQPVRSLEESAMTNRATLSLPDGSFKLMGMPAGLVAWRVDIPGECSRTARIDQEVVDVGVVRLRRLHEIKVRLFLSDPPEGVNYKRFSARVCHDGRIIDDLMFPRDGRLVAQAPAGTVQIDLFRPEGLLCSRIVTVPATPLEICLDALVSELRILHPPVAKESRFSLWLVPEPEAGPVDATRTTRGLSYGSWGTESPLLWRDAELSLTMQLPGTYDISLRVEDREPVHLGRATLVAGTVTTLEPEDATPATLRGRLIDLDNKPITHAPVAAALVAFDTGSRSSRKRVLTDSAEDGRFLFEGLCPGRWILFPESLGPFAREARSLDLKPGSAVDIDLIAAQPGRITGSVRSSGEPFPSAVLYLSPRGESATRIVHETKSDASGGYAFEQIFPGSYELRAILRDPSPSTVVRARQIRNVEVRPSETVSVDFDADVGQARIVVKRDGETFTDWSVAVVLTSDGVSWLRAVPGEPTVFVARLDPGPCLFMFQASKTFPILDGRSPPDCFHFAYLASVPAGAQEVVANIDGADLVVQASVPGTAMPIARFVRIGPFEDVQWTGQMIYVDESAGRRRFPAIPVAATVVLESSGLTWVSARREIRIDSRQELTVPWPP